MNKWDEALTSQLESVAKSWDGCKYDALGEIIDIGADIRQQGQRYISDGVIAGSLKEASELIGAAIAESWERSVYEDVGESIDIGEDIRLQFERIIGTQEPAK